MEDILFTHMLRLVLQVFLSSIERPFARYDSPLYGELTRHAIAGHDGLTHAARKGFIILTLLVC